MGEAANVVAVDTRNRAAGVRRPGHRDRRRACGTCRNGGPRTPGRLPGEDAWNCRTRDNVGSPVTANDPDPNADPLTYTLGGDRCGCCSGSRATVRSRWRAGTELDYETKDTYMVTVMAEDSFGASATIMVTIMVTDMDEAPEIMVGGLGIGGSNNSEYAEDRTAAVETYTASAPTPTWQPGRWRATTWATS